MKTDNQLLQTYAAQRSESAFRELVERHIGLVHSAALRESKGNVSSAEDTTQAVFTELARRAGELERHPSIAGWLYTCVRRMAANVRRSEQRRQIREQEAFTMNQLLNPDASNELWQQVRPVLDDVMHELSEEERTAVVLRFFEGKSLREVGTALGLTENAARMRVERCLAKLEHLLAQRGVTSTPSTLTAVLAAGAVMTVPSSLVASVTRSAIASAGSTGSILLALRTLWNTAKGKALVAGVITACFLGVVLWHPNQSTSENSLLSTHTPPEQIPSADRDAGAKTPQTPPEASPTPIQSNPSQMLLRLVDAESGETLPEARLHLAYLLQDGRSKGVKRVADLDGQVQVDFIQPPYRNLNMFVTADAHVPKVITWGRGHTPMPAEYTMKLARGVMIGGTVIDEAGKPIAGAQLEFDGPGNNAGLQENIQFGPDTLTFADPDGRWSCNMVPREYEEVTVIATHDEHAETKAFIRPGSLEATSFAITMKAGFTVAGVVQDLNGTPVPAAKIRTVRMNSEGEVKMKTDASGIFEFKSMKAGELILSVQAKGFAPAVQTLQVTGSVADVQFRLSPGQLLRGRLVDEGGKPIANAWVETTRRAIDKVQWSATTDSEGRFAWDSAPAEPLLYSCQVEGFARVYALELRADGSEHTIKMSRESPGKDMFEVSGSVVDADSGQPLDSFKVMVGDLTPDWAFPLRFGALGKEGRFSLSLRGTSSHDAYKVYVEKDGFLTGVSSELVKRDGNQTLDFRLQRGSGPAGVVLTPAGEPTANAAVLLCTELGGVTMNGPARVETGLNTSTLRVQTDANGRFALPAANNPHGLIVVHDQGFAELSPVQSDTTLQVTLQAWGRVEGRVVLESKPIANERVVAYNHTAAYSEAGRRFTYLTYHFETTTDSQGRFSFEKVPPGSCKVFRQKLISRTGFESHETPVAVKAGATAQVTLGGTGRPVIGKAVLPGVSTPIPWQTVAVRLSSKRDGVPSVRPNRADFTSRAAYIAAAEQFFTAAQAARRFGVMCDADGAFRLSDVPSGTYELAIYVRDSRSSSVVPDDVGGQTPQLGSLVREITIPEAVDGQAGDVVDLGVLNLELATQQAKRD